MDSFESEYVLSIAEGSFHNTKNFGFINGVDKTKNFRVLLPHRRSNTVSLETTSFINFHDSVIWLPLPEFSLFFFSQQGKNIKSSNCSQMALSRKFTSYSKKY